MRRWKIRYRCTDKHTGKTLYDGYDFTNQPVSNDMSHIPSVLEDANRRLEVTVSVVEEKQDI